MLNQKFKTYENTQTVTDLQTGEAHSISEVVHHRVPAEPPFVKIYLDDICALSEVPKSQKDILYYLVRKLDYDGYITISKRYREFMCKELGIQPRSLTNKIHLLAKSGLIKTIGTNEYEANPYFFARGAWVDILNRRKEGDFSLTINYNTRTGDRTFSSSCTESIEE